MFKFLSKGVNNNKGFTLVELLVVIAIIAIIALIAVPRFGGFTESAKQSADEATAKTIENGLTMYMAQGGTVTAGSYTLDAAYALDAPEGGGNLESFIGEIDEPQQEGKDWEIVVDAAGNIEVSAEE